MTNFLQIAFPFVAVFCLTFITEWCWARYNIASAARIPLASALWSAGIVLIGTLSTQVWLTNHWTVISSVSASLIGTYCAIKWGKEKEDAK
jgi:hypothetical protein